MREGEFVDIEVGSGADVSGLLASTGADTYLVLETRLSVCGGHHVAAGGGKLHAGFRCWKVVMCEAMLCTCLYDSESWTLASHLRRQDLGRCGDGLPC